MDDDNDINRSLLIEMLVNAEFKASKKKKLKAFVFHYS